MARRNDESDEPEALAAGSARVLGIAEDFVQALVGLLLIVAAFVVLVQVAYHLAMDIDEGAEKAVGDAINGLLTVFILLELLAGLRATLVKRKLVAEPFLVVGIIASIRGIIVSALDAKTLQGAAFDDAMTQMAVLGLLALTLAAAAFVIRRKEREPIEE
jgi:uncharacterized membrane protein (DUF373 family)